ncbi:YcaO-like family protein [Halobaculum sp. MBLA0143]|uniref:YcaO-like family protein n=1 Tax=Halobaculum sp. MBLA0143 TaxID=3079933 RepID=UPI00352451F8
MIDRLQSESDPTAAHGLAISDRTGIVTRTVETDLSHLFDGYLVVRSVVSDLTALFDTSKQLTTGGAAVEHSRQQARDRAVGEALERYSIERPPTETVVGTAETVDGALWWEPHTDAQYDDSALFSCRPTPNDEREWIGVTHIRDGTTRRVPASTVYLGASGYGPLKEATSTGAACHTTLPRAVLGGLLEAIERDAAAISLLNGLPRQRLSTRVVADAAPARFAALSDAGLNVTVVDVTSDLPVPSYFAFATDGTWLSVGGSCHPLAETAVSEALEEVMHTYYSLREVYDVEPDDVADPTALERLNHHLMYYQGDRRRILLDRVPDETVSLRSDLCHRDATTPELLASVVDCLDDAGIDTYFHETTSGDLREIGVRTAAVVAPELVDINARYNARQLGCDRLYTVPERLSYEAGLVDEPHPIP